MKVMQIWGIYRASFVSMITIKRHKIHSWAGQLERATRCCKIFMIPTLFWAWKGFFQWCILCIYIYTYDNHFCYYEFITTLIMTIIRCSMSTGWKWRRPFYPLVFPMQPIAWLLGHHDFANPNVIPLFINGYPPAIWHVYAYLNMYIYIYIYT